MRLIPAKTLERCGIDGATRVLVGLSGGADSVALLDALHFEQGILELLLLAQQFLIPGRVDLLHDPLVRERHFQIDARLQSGVTAAEEVYSPSVIFFVDAS